MDRAVVSPRRVGDYLAFHTGAPRAAAPDKAAFALVDLAADGLDLARFAQGTAEYPDRSTTHRRSRSDSLARGAALAARPARASTAKRRSRVSPLPDRLSSRNGRPTAPASRSASISSSPPTRGSPRCRARPRSRRAADVCRGQGRRARDPQRPRAARRQAARRPRRRRRSRRGRSTSSFRSPSIG